MWWIHTGHRIDKHISFFKTGMWSHLSPPSPKKQPHGVSAPGSTRLSSSPADLLRLRDKTLEFFYVFQPPPQVTRVTSIHVSTSSPAAELIEVQRANLQPWSSSRCLQGCAVQWNQAHICETTWCDYWGCFFTGKEAAKHKGCDQCTTLGPRSLQHPVCLGRGSQSPV